MEIEHWLSLALAIVALLTLKLRYTLIDVQKRLAEIEETRERDRWRKDKLDNFTLPCMYFYDALRSAYRTFTEEANGPELLDQAIGRARCPEIDPAIPANVWRDSQGDSFDSQSDHLYRFAAKIYPKRPDREPRNGSILSEQYPRFHEVRQSIAYYIDQSSEKREKSQDFANFLESDRPVHASTAKMAAYLELALSAALGTTAYKLGLFKLAKAWNE